MAHILVGDPDCSYDEIVRIFEEKSISTLKINWWTTLAMHLDIPSDSMTNWQNDLLIGKLKHIDVIRELLEKWRKQKSKDATLGAFYAQIPDTQRQLKDFVQAKIRDKAKCWNHLDSDSQTAVLRTRVKFLGRNYSLSSIRDIIHEDKLKDILFKAEMKEYFLKSFKNEEWDLGHYDIPKPLSHYIHRKLTLKRQLNPEIFKHECLDIFLIEGIQHHRLSILARPELTDTSSEQLNKVDKQITRRFILLEHPDDCSEINKLAKHPVHRIKLENDKFFWLSTSGSCQTIRIFLLNDEEEIQEATLFKEQLFAFNNRPLAICSSPGMGKSVLLANLAKEMMNYYSNRIIVYLELRLLISKLSLIGPEMEFENVKQILVSSSSLSLIGKQIVLEFLNKKDLEFEIFLDGFDELSLQLLQPAKHFLKSLLKCPNMRVYITSRPHMKNDIENTLEVVSLDIAPFNQENQMKLFCDFWEVNQNIENREKLSQFAKTVMQSLEFINPSMTSDFAGIPLQCFMLAQVYANQAKMYCNREHFNFQATNSLYELYNKFTKYKFKNIAECDIYFIKVHHWKEALMLLFPDNQQASKILQEISSKRVTEEVSWEAVFSVGILEYSPDKPNFVHRTFPEYFLAEFIVEELLISEVVDINTSVQFIIESVLYVDETNKGHILSEADIYEIRDFIQSSESWLDGHLNLKKLKSVLISQCDLPFEVVRDDLFQILSSWLYKKGPNGTMDVFDSAFKVLGCDQLLDDLHRNVFQYNRVLQHEMMCIFLDTALQTYDTILALKKYCYREDTCVSLTQGRDQLKWKLLTCTEHNYQFLTKLLVRFYRETSIIKNVLRMDVKMCEQLLVRASYHDNIEFFKYICETGQLIMETNSKDFFKTFTFTDGIYEYKPLVESIKRRNYQLVEYLFNCIVDDAKDINSLWLACVQNSWQDLPNTILNKVKILLLLKETQKIQVNRLEQIFPNGVNVVLLTTLYDMCDYIPTFNDMNLITMSTSFCCSRDAEFGNLANWLLLKNLAHLLTHFCPNKHCLLAEALLKNVVKPETLTIIYKKHHFDLGIIFPSAVLCVGSEAIIQTVIELSGDVNFVDKYKSTLLHWAAGFKKLNLIKYLVSMGANVNSRNAFGNTPMYNVFQNETSPESFHSIHDIVWLLITYKGDGRAKNIAGLLALDLAKANQVDMSIEERTIELLEKSIHQNNDIETDFKISKDVLKFTQLWYTTLLESIKCKRFLTLLKNVIHISGNVNISNPQNSSLLHYAALVGEVEAIEYLLVNGANANLKNNHGNTPLHNIFDCSWRNKSKVVTLLNTETQWIHPCVQLLVKYNADVCVKNNQQKTPLNRALEEKDILQI